MSRDHHRVPAAATAVGAYTVATGNAEEPKADVLGDLLADLHHYADRHGLDWHALTDRAERHFTSELYDSTGDEDDEPDEDHVREYGEREEALEEFEGKLAAFVEAAAELSAAWAHVPGDVLGDSYPERWPSFDELAHEAGELAPDPAVTSPWLLGDDEPPSQLAELRHLAEQLAALPVTVTDRSRQVRALAARADELREGWQS